jgi:hypothetical protein
MIPLNVLHLLDPDAVPDGLPGIAAPLSSSETIIAGDGIGIQEINGDYIVSVNDSVVQEAVRAVVIPPQEDPLTGMGFRVSYADGVVSINRGYILNSYYVNPQWKSEETRVPAGEISINPDSTECSIYIAIAMAVYRGEENSPWNTYDSAAYIESNNYTSTITLRTEWSGLDLTQFFSPGEPSLFEVYYEEFPTFPVDTKIRIKLADIDEDGVVDQSHLGLITLPQTYETKVQAWNFRASV